MNRTTLQTGLTVQVLLQNFARKKVKFFQHLFQVALVVFAAAGTRVSVERLFLKFILKDQRDNLTSENLANILLVMNYI